MEQHLVNTLLKLAVAASLASVFIRLSALKRMLLRDERSLVQRLRLALSLSAMFGLGVLTRIVTGVYKAADLGLEGSFLCGILGGYLSGLVSGVLISVPAIAAGEYATMPLFAGVGVIGGLLRDLAPDKEEIWRFSPFLDRLRSRNLGWRVRLFHLLFLLTILFTELLRWTALILFPKYVFALYDPGAYAFWLMFSMVLTSVFTVTLPLKIWNNARNEEKLETQQRLLNEARLAALTRQINPHFLFNTLNSISSLIRTDPEQARRLIYRLSNILRRLLRKTENLTPLREELQFIDDYMGIELVRFGDKLQFLKEVDPGTMDCLVPGMLLQPIVENSIKHGLSSKVDGGMIRLRSRLQDGRLHLLVEDNGVGIPESKLATLFEQGIGISNVNERLKVLFGADYRMGIDSRPGRGTQTELEIPELKTLLNAAV